MRLMVRVAAGALILTLVFSSAALAKPVKGNGNGNRTGVRAAGRKASNAGAYSPAAGASGRSEETSQTPEHGKGRRKFQLEGTVTSTGVDSVSILIKTGTNSVKELRGRESVFEVTGSTKITLKGRPLTIDEILAGDRVHVGGTIDSSGAEPRLIASRVIVRPRRGETSVSIEASSTPDGSDDATSSVDSSDTTPFRVGDSRTGGSGKKGGKAKSVSASIISWLQSLF